MFQRRRPPREEEPPAELSGGTISAIKPQVRDAERVSVFLDGRFAFGIGADTADAEGLCVGDVIDDARVASLVSLDEGGRATTSALHLLARRPRSAREIQNRLRQKGFSVGAVDAAIAKLEGWRYLDDADFARYWVENREANRPRGKRLLEQELMHKGVDREVARAAVDEADPDERAAALTMAKTKLRSYSGLEEAVVRRRLGGFLARRGYGFDVIQPVMDQVLSDDEDDEAPSMDDLA